MKIYIANNPAALESINPDCTIEAEFGSIVVKGAILTLAHHGDHGDRPCPCSLGNFPDMGIKSVGVSHIDLDTLGGLMAVQGIKPSKFDWVKDFWKVAAMIDIQGIHKFSSIMKSKKWLCPEMIEETLNAFYAFSESEEGRVFAPRDGSSLELEISRHFWVLQTLLTFDECRGGIDDHEHNTHCGCPDWKGWGWKSPSRLNLIDAGREWAKNKKHLEEQSYIGTAGSDVLVRSADQFINHLYTHNNRLGKVIVGFNTKTNWITISICDPIEGFSCVKFAQEIWGDQAGGHPGIAGCPRHLKYTIEDAKAVAIAIAERLK